MTVNELIDNLKKCPGDVSVIMQSPDEDNGYVAICVVALMPRNSDGQPCQDDDADESIGQCVALWS